MGVTRTAALRPLMLVTVHVEVEPLQITNWLELHTYQISPSVDLLQVGRPVEDRANCTFAGAADSLDELWLSLEQPTRLAASPIEINADKLVRVNVTIWSSCFD